jgi:hypothetical protein
MLFLTKFIVWPLDGSADVPGIDPRDAETRWPIPHPTPAPTCCYTNNYNIISHVIVKNELSATSVMTCCCSNMLTTSCLFFSEPVKYYKKVFDQRSNSSSLALHCKTRLAVFPSPAGMSPTKLSLVGNNLIMPRWGRENH